MTATIRPAEASAVIRLWGSAMYSTDGYIGSVTKRSGQPAFIATIVLPIGGIYLPTWNDIVKAVAEAVREVEEAMP